MLNSNALRKLDMQDLMVFVAVYEQNSVSGVSEALCVSQSTVSYCLKKLRAGFEDFNVHTLLQDDFVCVFDRRAAPSQPRLALQSFIERRLVFPTPWTSTSNMVNGWLAQQALQRQIVARANSYGAALKMISGTDFLLTPPRRIQQLLADESAFQRCEAPDGLPGFTLDMQWRQGTDQDSANAWLREQVIAACAQA